MFRQVSRTLGYFVAALIWQLAAAQFATAQSSQLMDNYNRYKMNLEAGDYAAAAVYAGRTLARAKQEFRNDDSLIADRTSDLAGAEMMAGDLSNSIRHYRNAIDLYEDAFGRNNENIVRPLLALARAYDLALDTEKADAAYLRSIRLLERHVGMNHVNTAMALGKYAEFLAEDKKTIDDALGFIDRARRALEGSKAVPPRAMFEHHVTNGIIRSKLRDYRKAEQSFSNAEDLVSEGLKVERTAMSDLYLELAAVNAQMRRNNEARSYFFKARPGETSVIPVFQPEAATPSSTDKRSGTNLKGRVVVEFSVGLDGKTKNIRVVTSKPDSTFGAAAQRAVANWEYLPPMNEEGKNVQAHGIRETFTFNMAMDNAGFF